MLSLEIVVCYRKLGSSRNLGQFRYVTRETRYHVSITELLIWSLYSQVAELVRRTRTMLKILYFSRGYEFFKILSGIKFIYDRGRKLILLLAGEAYFGIEETISANL